MIEESKTGIIRSFSGLHVGSLCTVLDSARFLLSVLDIISMAVHAHRSKVDIFSTEHVYGRGHNDKCWSRAADSHGASEQRKSGLEPSF